MKQSPLVRIDPKISSRVLLLFFISICFLLCYYFLQPAIKSWDEAVYASNAFEMSKTGNWWVMYNNGQPDLFNTKPPLVIWFQSIFISIFGLNEFAIRLPSFISLFCLVIFLFKFLERRLKNLAFPFLVISILLSSYGFIGFHGFATGDLDATLCLWVTLYSLIFFDKILLAAEKTAPKWIYLSGLFFFLAFLTKSAAAFLPLPGLVVSLFLFKKQKSLFYNKHFYTALFFIVLFISGYYFLMEYKQPGYFSHAWHSEYERIYRNNMPWHAHPFKYYFINLTNRFFPWVWFLLPSILFTFRSKSDFVKRITLFSSVFVICYFLIISIPAVKLEWYDIPAYPFLAIITSVTFYELFYLIKSVLKNRKRESYLFGFILFSVLTGFVLAGCIKKIKHPSFEEPLEREGYALRHLINKPMIKNLKILMYAEHPEHYNQVNFYREKYFDQYSVKPAIFQNEQGIHSGDTILICQTEKFLLSANFYSDTIEKIQNCFLIHIKDIAGNTNSNTSLH